MEEPVVNQKLEKQETDPSEHEKMHQKFQLQAS
jgi:hypothetical protein